MNYKHFSICIPSKLKLRMKYWGMRHSSLYYKSSYIRVRKVPICCDCRVANTENFQRTLLLVVRTARRAGNIVPIYIKIYKHKANAHWTVVGLRMTARQYVIDVAVSVKAMEHRKLYRASTSIEQATEAHSFNSITSSLARMHVCIMIPPKNRW